MRVGIYPAALHVLGGGEKYIGKIAEILSRDHSVSLLCFDRPDKASLEARLNLDLSRVAVEHIPRPAWLRAVRHWPAIGMVDLFDACTLSKHTKDYDLFVNQEHRSFVPSLAKHSILVCEVPPTTSFAKDNPLTRLSLDPRSRTYSGIVVNSAFTKKWADIYYGRETIVVNPPVDTAFFKPASKEKVILSVGRFSTSLHCKNQLEMMRAFKRMYSGSSLKGWEYHLVGGLGSRSYLEACQAEAGGCPVHFHTDASFEVVRQLYGKARIFWHATGMREDQYRHPERMEHFGITTVEAMSAGCVPVVIDKGGQPEIVEDGVSGFLFGTVDDLINRTLDLVRDIPLWERMSAAAIQRSQRFGLASFESMLYHALDECGVPTGASS